MAVGDDPTVERSTTQEIGLRLPDGTQLWGPDGWHGLQFATPEDRLGVVESIRAAARNLGMDEDETVGRYRWVIRTTVNTVFTFTEAEHAPAEIDLTDPRVLPTPAPVGAPPIVDGETVYDTDDPPIESVSSPE